MRKEESSKKSILQSLTFRLAGVLIVALMGLTMIFARSAKADDSDPTWEGFSYYLDEEQHVILLLSYEGDQTSIRIPSKATMEGVDYTPSLCSDFNFDITGEKEMKDKLVSFSVGEGVILDTGASLFEGYTKLKTVDLSKAVLGEHILDVEDLKDMFKDCEDLEEVDLSGLDLSGIAREEDSYETVLEMFSGNDALREVKLPAVWGNVDKISLGKVMYVKDGERIAEDPILEASRNLAGKTMVAFPIKERVKIETVDKTVTYDGNMIDVTDMFKIPEGLEVRSYSLSDGSAGSMTGSKIEVFKAGTYSICVSTKETLRYEEGSATAVLTVKRAKGNGNVTVEDVKEGTKPSPSASSSTNPGDPTFFYKKRGVDDNYYSSEVPTEVGEYTVMAVFPDADLYECRVTADFAILADQTGKENGTDQTQNPYAEYGLSAKNVPVGYEDHSGSPMIKQDQADCSWNAAKGKDYWYEGGIKQGTYYDPKAVLGEDPESHVATARGREIYDAKADNWYWLDTCYDGARAIGKEVWIPYIFQDEAGWDDAKMREVANESDEGMRDLVYQFMKEKKGKWVRYDRNGAMLRGWVEIKDELADLYPDQAGNVYYYDHKTGLMAKGEITIDGVTYYFDEITGKRL